MKTFIYRIFLFSIFGAFCYIILLFLWGQFAPDFLKTNLNYRIGSYGHMYTRIQEARKTSDVDILILGSSHAYRGFDPRVFNENGYSSFNLGSSNQTPIQTSLLLKRYLKDIKPKLVIYEVYPGSFISDGVESSVDIFANDKNDFLSLKMSLEINNIISYNTLLYGYLVDFFGINNSFQEPLNKQNEQYISGGYVEKEIENNSEFDFSENQWNLKPNQIKHFEQIIHMIKEQNISLLLVQAPVTSNLYKSYSNNEAFDKIMESYGKYVNFNTMLDLDDVSDFYDPEHLNQRGVEKFNESLIQYLDAFKEF